MPPDNAALDDALNETYPLGSLGHQIDRHWKKYRPKMYAALEKEGKLRESLYAAATLTSGAVHGLMLKHKLPHNQAWEMMREEWAFLPSEEDVPGLGFDPRNLLAQIDPSDR